MFDKNAKQMSLRQSIFRILVVAICLTASLILLNVWTATSGLVKKQLNKNLEIAQSVFERFIDDRQRQLTNSANVLTSDFGFKQAVASKDSPTIASALENYSRRIDADFMAITDLDATVLESEPDYFENGAPFPYPEMVNSSLSGNSTKHSLIVNNTLHQVVMLPVRAPSPQAMASIGFALDDNFLKELKEYVHADIVIYREMDNKSADVLHSTIDKARAQKVINNPQSDVSWLDITLKEDSAYVTHHLLLPDWMGDEMTILLVEDASAQFESFVQLELNIVLISLLAIGLTIAMTFVLSKRVSKPLAGLVAGVNYIAEGHYEKTIVIKDRIKELTSLANAFNVMRNSIRSREEHIRYQAQHDMLTGLYNRNFMEQKIADKLIVGEAFQAIAVKIQGFRTLNDVYGFVNGDDCLKNIAKRLNSEDGLAGRISGGELIWIPTKILQESELLLIKQKLDQPVKLPGLLIPLKTAFGVITCPEQGNSTEEIFRKLNIVVDQDETTKSQIHYYDPKVENSYLRRLTIVTELKVALSEKNEELHMVYQPKLDLHTNKVTGVEALIRWVNGTLGFVPPDEFIEIAEDAGIIELVTTWVIEQVIADLSHFRMAGFDISAAINFSTQDIQNAALLSLFTEKLHRAGFTANDVVLEITESDLVEDANTAITNLNNLKEQGYSLAIDDFGTGYSSLAYLKNLPVSTIKIDKSFVLNLSKDKDDQQIVKTVIALAKVFNLSVVAEGIENEESMRLLAEWGCHIGQGYFISKPVKCAELINWLKESA